MVAGHGRGPNPGKLTDAERDEIRLRSLYIARDVGVTRIGTNEVFRRIGAGMPPERKVVRR